MSNKKSNGLLINSDGKIELLTFNSKFIPLSELQKSVKGYFEFIYMPNDMIMVVNEEGKLNKLPINEIATNIFALNCKVIDIIVGDVLLVNRKHLIGNNF